MDQIWGVGVGVDEAGLKISSEYLKNVTHEDDPIPKLGSRDGHSFGEMLMLWHLEETDGSFRFWEVSYS